MTFLREIIPFDTHSTANLLPLGILKKVFFRKKPIFFENVPNVLRNPNKSVAFYGKFVTIWLKNNFTFRSVNKLVDVACAA